MRMHIDLDDDLVAQVDRIAGPRGRSRFVRTAVERAVQQEMRWTAIEAAAGAIDDDPPRGSASSAGSTPDARADHPWACTYSIRRS